MDFNMERQFNPLLSENVAGAYTLYWQLTSA
jgi:hypothetical protein